MHTKDYRLIELDAELELAWNAERQLEVDHKAGRQHSNADYEEGHRRVSRVVDKIKKTRAHTIAGLRVKARAIAWCHSGERRIRFTDNQTTDVQLAQSIVADLLAA